MAIVGWIVWVLFVLWGWTCFRILADRKRGLAGSFGDPATDITTLLYGLGCLVVAAVFLFVHASKLHLLWIGPAMFIPGMLAAKLRISRIRARNRRERMG